MTSEHVKDIAHVVLNAIKMREESWNESTSRYGMTDTEAFEKALADMKMPEELAYLLHLAEHWYNDLQSWAEAVLQGKYREMFVNNNSSEKEEES